jgi:acyl-coenzyme A synthetase/AMP-(fatty) acid ligase
MKQPLLDKLREIDHAGLVLFTSGTSGEPKAVVHDFTRLMDQYKVKRPAYRTIAFLPLDHMGGLNTLFHILYNGGCLIIPQSRDPEYICRLIETYEVELLPTTPSFLNMLLVSKVYESFDLSSLKIISYGTEPMPQHTLSRLKEIFPKVKLQQKYGLSEMGVFRSRSKDDGSLWIQMECQTRVVDGLLEIKSDTAMLGYINAPSPFTDDGWYRTGDMVEVDGDYLKILGRKSELINIGGMKIHPMEIESVIQEMDITRDVVVMDETNFILGKIVTAKIVTDIPISEEQLLKEIRSYCKGRIDKCFIPMKVFIVEESLISGRYKKIRK